MSDADFLFEDESKDERVQEKGDYVLILADNSAVRVEVEGGTRHNGLPVIRSYYDPQSTE